MANPPPPLYSNPPYSQDQSQYPQQPYGQQHQQQPYGHTQQYQQQHGGQVHPHSGEHPAYDTKFSELSMEERKVMAECTSESFWYRSLPIASLFSGAAHIAVEKGILKPSMRYGSKPKVILAAIFGYFVGKVSYANTCADKFLNQAPRSALATTIRKNRGLPELEPLEIQEKDYGGLGVPQGQLGVPQGQPAAPQPPSGYDALRIQNRESAVMSQPQHQQPQQPLSGYDELRRKNREIAPPPSYQQRPVPQVQPYSGEGHYPPPPPDQGGQYPPPPPVISQPPPLYSPPPSRPGASTSKYGDEGFE